VKLALRLSCIIVSLVTFGVCAVALAQSTSPTPDPFVAQISSSCEDDFAGNMSGNGRFIVIESMGDIATLKPGETQATKSPNNADGNREIFLYDYAQRRIFQITDTRSAVKVVASPTPTPTPTPTPSPGVCPARLDLSTIDIEVSNNRPFISNDGRWIVFSSNATNPASFDGNVAANRTALAADGNQEVWLYQVPTTPEPADFDLSQGIDAAQTALTGGVFTRVTNTPASRLPTPGVVSGGLVVPPFVADDNRDATVTTLNENDPAQPGSPVVAFVSTRNLVTGGNTDLNAEVFIYNGNTGVTAQVTNTVGTATAPVFSSNPTLSGGGGRVAFYSNANITAGGASNNADLNGEIYLATYNGTTATVTRQVTKTTVPTSTGAVINTFGFGRRISRDGNFLAFESLSAAPTTNGALQTTRTLFLYDITLDTVKSVGPRATSGEDIFRFPTFTDNGATLVFGSVLNFKADGTAPATAAEGLNPNFVGQLFATPTSAPTTFTRLTSTPSTSLGSRLQALTSNSRRRLAFVLDGTELGGGNSDLSIETFYLVSPSQTSETLASANAVNFSTGLSNRPVVGPSPAPTPPNVAGLAPGMIGIVRPAPSPAPVVVLAPSSRAAGSASVTQNSPPLPIELNGVSVSINNAAAGLYFVGANQINFVVPIGLAAQTGTATYPVVINNNGAVIRSALQVMAAQPDVATSTGDANGRAIVLNVTNSMSSGTSEPFSIMSLDASGTSVQTILRIILTGVRPATAAQVTVTIGTTAIPAANIVSVGPAPTAGFDQIDFKLPATLAGSTDVPVIVTTTISSVTTSSRAADGGAPRITILP
jgi:uncharacterized protein (TIGR03437 family)